MAKFAVHLITGRRDLVKADHWHYRAEASLIEFIPHSGKYKPGDPEPDMRPIAWYNLTHVISIKRVP